MLIVPPQQPDNSQSDFQYQLLPSAFQVAEWPTYRCWKAIQDAGDMFSKSPDMKSRSIAVLHLAGGYLGGIVALPITLCASPVALVADVVIGVGEYLYCRHHHVKSDELKMILHRKWVVSPCQHLTFCLGAILGLGSVWVTLQASSSQEWVKGRIIEWVSATVRRRPKQYAPFAGSILPFKIALIFWSAGYSFGQRAVGSLPTRFNHHTFNIFTGGGAGEGAGKWLDTPLFENLKGGMSSEAPKVADAKYIEAAWYSFLDNILNDLKPHLKTINDATLDAEYVNFKRRLLRKEDEKKGIKRCTPKELIGLSVGESPTKKYRKLAMILHPDKNGPRKEEAGPLFAALQEAYKYVQQDPEGP